MEKGGNNYQQRIRKISEERPEVQYILGLCLHRHSLAGNELSCRHSPSQPKELSGFKEFQQTVSAVPGMLKSWWW